MEEPLIIYMGVPEQKHFVMPWSGPFPPMGQAVTFIHPRTKKADTGIVVDYYTETWASLPDIFCVKHFNCNCARLKKGLEGSYPQFRGSRAIRFILFKEA